MPRSKLPAITEKDAESIAYKVNFENFFDENTAMFLPFLRRKRRQLQRGVLFNISQSFHFAAKRIKKTLREGKTYKTANFEGQVIEQEVNLNAQDIASLTTALKSLTEKAADFYLLPHGAISSDIVGKAESSPDQHLHLHSHGARNSSVPINAINTKKLTLPTVCEVVDIETTVHQSDLLEDI